MVEAHYRAGWCRLGGIGARPLTSNNLEHPRLVSNTGPSAITRSGRPGEETALTRHIPRAPAVDVMGGAVRGTESQALRKKKEESDE
ncbi:hypothetical protein [Streptomyces sp. enrichment culture]|uniref:hypothetical protein n=1 Tax=Streptomyces sp. enrichment culture TaxID=1795815 RepID=UPI003F552DB3